MEPKTFPPHVRLGLAYSDLGLYQKAADEYRLSAAVYPAAGFSDLASVHSGHADEALHTMEPVKPYEFGTHAFFFPNYLRGLAYLQLRKAGEAVSEFRAVLDHRGVAPMAPAWVLSQLGLARAYTLQGDAAKARAAYQEFFALWKDADPDIPILKQATAEYVKLK